MFFFGVGGVDTLQPPTTPQGVNGEACALGIASMTRLFRSAKLLKSLVFRGHRNGGNFGMKAPWTRRHESMGIDPGHDGHPWGGTTFFFAHNMTYEWLIFIIFLLVKVGKYTIRGSCGYRYSPGNLIKGL